MIPKLEKVVLNMGIGEAVADTKKVKSAHNDLMLIAGQLPVFTKAKKRMVVIKNGDHSLSSNKGLKILKKEIKLITS